MKKYESVGTILDRVLKSLEIDKKIDEEKAVAVWPRVVGEKIANKTRPVRVIRGRLLVETAGSAWAHECKMLRGDIIRKLNQAIGSDVITDITFKAGAFDK